MNCKICYRDMCGLCRLSLNHQQCVDDKICSCQKINLLINGGQPEIKSSNIITKLFENFLDDNKYSILSFNGTDGAIRNTQNKDLILWFPDISNEEEKNYPKKDKGAVLICSKVMREGYSELDAITRIFKMNGNAVVAIYKDDPKKMRFKLIDALGNCWIDTYDINMLCVAIREFYDWTKKSIRVSLKYNQLPKEISDMYLSGNKLDFFIYINNKLSNKVVSAIGKRFFGNLSTRCMKLFPTVRKQHDIYFISPRNVDKSKLTEKDFIICDKTFHYYGDRKPSVDSPIQISLYNKFPEINYMIHGHAYISDVEMTSEYVPCGDMREVDEILKIWGDEPMNINLKNHGFIIVAKTLEELDNIINNVKMESL